MEQAENIDENLVNHGKAESHAEGVASPVDIERRRIIVPECREYYGKSHQLRKHVTKKKLEFAVQAVLNHEPSDPDLKDGMRDPERIIENFDFLVHLFSLFGKATLRVGLKRPHSCHQLNRHFSGSFKATLAFPHPVFNGLK